MRTWRVLHRRAVSGRTFRVKTEKELFSRLCLYGKIFSLDCVVRRIRPLAGRFVPRPLLVAETKYARVALDTNFASRWLLSSQDCFSEYSEQRKIGWAFWKFQSDDRSGRLVEDPLSLWSHSSSIKNEFRIHFQCTHELFFVQKTSRDGFGQTKVSLPSERDLDL